MDFRFIVQIVLILLIILISTLFFKKYFFVKQKKENVENIQKIEEKIPLSEETENIIQNIKYVSVDNQGNEYIIKAKNGEVKKDNKNILILYDVFAEIDLVGKSPIYINSKFAEYNKKNFDTKFYEDINVNYEENKLFSNNFDIFFKDNKAIMYNEIYFESLLTESKADLINFDLLNGNVEIKMYKKTKNVIIKSKNDGYN